MAKRKQTKGLNDQQNTTQKTKDRATRTPLKTKTGDELRCSEMINSSCATSGTRLVAPVTHLTIGHE